MAKVNDNIKITIPHYPKLILDTLYDNGYDAYIVGGCVRDNLLKKNPDDYDITTNAKPDEVKKLFKRTVDIGIKHGTVAVVFYEKNIPYTYEVTTYRKDGEYDDGRHPNNVEFVDDLREDLLRRDFTINAMAYNDKRGLVDEFGGVADLNNKIIRAVGNPVERFTEDALRLLRAVRFSSKLGFEIEKETEKAIIDLSAKLINVSKERVEVELTKIITGNNPSYVDKIYDLGLAKYICDGFEDIKVGRFEPNLSVFLAYSCLLYNTDIDKAIAILKKLKLDNNNINKIKLLLEAKKFCDKIYSCSNDTGIEKKIIVKELINYLGYDLVYDFIKLISINENDKILLDYIKENVDAFKNDNCPIFIKDLAINGNEVMNLGFAGVEVGTTLSWLLKIVHKNRDYNKNNILKDILKRVYQYYKGDAYEL